MKLVYWKGRPNFGDALNPWLWPRVMPRILDDDPASVFYGIGTLLHGNTRGIENPISQTASRRFVMGTGAGYLKYSGGHPLVPDESWTFYCVRGPRTADQLHLPRGRAATDPAALIQRDWLPDQPPSDGSKTAFMPHFRNASPMLAAACRQAGLHYIDPLRPVDTVLSALAGSQLVLAEAMHAAIVADALRIPWIAIDDSSNPDHEPFKWWDWCESLGMSHRPIALACKATGFAAVAAQVAQTTDGQLSTDQALKSGREHLLEAIERFRDQLRP